MLGDFLDSFPFQSLPQRIVVCGKTLHAAECFNNNFLLFQNACITDNQEQLNLCCSNLKYDNKVKQIQKVTTDINCAVSHVNDKYLSYTQMHKRADHLRHKNQELRLQCLISRKQIARLNKTLDIHQRIMICLKDHDIPKIQQILTAAINHDGSLTYILQKIELAVAFIQPGKQSR